MTSRSFSDESEVSEERETTGINNSASLDNSLANIKTEDADVGLDFVKTGVGRCRNRANNWTEHDKLLAAKMVIAHEESLYGSRETGHDMASKRAEWTRVTEKFCVEADEPRTPEQLKKAFENMRSAARKYMEMDMTGLALGGTYPPQKVPPPSVWVLIHKLRRTPRVSFMEYEDRGSRDDLAPSRKPDHGAHTPTSETECLRNSFNFGENSDSESDNNAGKFLENHAEGICKRVDRSSLPYLPFPKHKPSVPNVRNVDNSRNHSERDFLFNAHAQNSTSAADDTVNNEVINFVTRARKRKWSQTEESLDYWETQRVKAEYEKVRLETELIKQRMEQEATIFAFKKRALETKFQYFSTLIERTSVQNAKQGGTN